MSDNLRMTNPPGRDRRPQTLLVDVVEVDGCSSCPLRLDFDGRANPLCTAQGWPMQRDETPDWCPLANRPLLVHLSGAWAREEEAAP